MPASIAGVFTTNRIQAAPVLLCRKHLTGHSARAIVINSGNANACVGRQGKTDAEEMARLTAELLHIESQMVFVCSTGTIGIPMPMAIIKQNIPIAVKSLSRNGLSDAASAIMTTDTRPKQITIQMEIDRKPVTITGIAKGSGMINPDMATLLVFLTTDANIRAKSLQTCLLKTVEQSFNQITVDGDQSTNDTVLFMANGLAGNTSLDAMHPDWKTFCSTVNEITRQLALAIVKDGEGATKLVAITVKGARGKRSAEKIARAIAGSLLVKTSWFGGDPNWGRVLCAVGYAGVEIQPELIDIFYNDQQAVRHGQSFHLSHTVLHDVLSKHKFSITVDLHLGKSTYTVYTCDCSEEYVRINSSYMT